MRGSTTVVPDGLYELFICTNLSIGMVHLIMHRVRFLFVLLYIEPASVLLDSPNNVSRWAFLGLYFLEKRRERLSNENHAYELYIYFFPFFFSPQYLFCSGGVGGKKAACENRS